MKKENFIINPFSYSMVIDGEHKQTIHKAIIEAKDAIHYDDGTTANAVIYCEDKNGNVIEFDSVEEAQNYLDTYIENCTLEIKNKKELHAVISNIEIENNNEKELNNKSLEENNINDNSNHNQRVSPQNRAINENKKINNSYSKNHNEFLNYCQNKIFDLPKSKDMKGNEYFTLMETTIKDKPVSIIYVEGKENNLCWIDKSQSIYYTNNNPNIYACDMKFNKIDSSFLKVLNKYWDKLQLDEIMDINKSIYSEYQDLKNKTI